MGTCGDKCAAEYKVTREQQDDFAKESFRRAVAAQKEGLFDAEIEPVAVPQKKGEAIVHRIDEGPGKGDPSKFATLRPAFSKDGTITAANASSINDGASALVLASEKAVKEHKLEPLARIVGYGGAAQAPEWFTTAPAKAIDGTLSRLGFKKDQIDLYEINEAFAVVTMVCSKLCGLEPQKVNVRGGAVALGPPHRRVRRAHPHDAALRHEGPQREARPGEPLHRRRRGARGGRRALRRAGSSDGPPARACAKRRALRRADADAAAGDAHEQLRARGARGAARRAGDPARRRAARVDRVGAGAAHRRVERPSRSSRRTTTSTTSAASTCSRASSACRSGRTRRRRAASDTPVARRLADGEDIVLEGPIAERWRVLHTPGHAPGHVCLWNDEERAVVVGDMVASVGTILIEPDDGDMRLYLEQLERLAALDARVALPAHGEPIDDPTRLFRSYVAHRLMREAKVLAAVGRSRCRGRDGRRGSFRRAYDDAPMSVWPIALLSVRAHLKKLEDEGRVSRAASGGASVRYIAGIVSHAWQSAYLAVSVALGDSLDDALSSLPSRGELLAAEGAALAAALRSPSRDARVRTLARAVSEVALAVEATVLS